MSNTSFYGGPAGISFEIKEIFTTKVSLEAELTKGWHSNIQPGEYVVVSYGLPSDDMYDSYRIIDVNAYGKSYNSTLWQKVYNEDGEIADATPTTVIQSGFYYRMIASMTGNTPRIMVSNPAVIVENADYSPTIDYDNSNVDQPVITFHLPQGQTLIAEVDRLDAIDQDPVIGFDDGTQTTYADGTTGPTTTNVNHPKIILKVPSVWDIELGDVEWLPYAQRDDIDIEIENKDNNTKQINFKLPLGQTIDFEQLATETRNADQAPVVDIENTLDVDGDRHISMRFRLPRAQVMIAPESETVDPSVNPSVGWGSNNNVNNPQLKFFLPRAVKFFQGTQLGGKSQGAYSANIEGASVGDYYINQPTGFIYLATAATASTQTWTYQGCLQKPLPGVEILGKAPYEENDDGALVPTGPEIEIHYQDPTEETGERYRFTLPSLPAFRALMEIVGASEEGSLAAAPADETSFLFSFKIPKGTRWFVGTAVDDAVIAEGDIPVADSMVGDLYLNNVTGYVYEQTALGVWVKQAGNGLIGPVGKALNILDSVTIDGDASGSPDDTLAAVGAYLTAEDYDPTSDQLIAVSYRKDNVETAYWYFKVDSSWSRVQLTGGVDNLLQQDYDPDGSTTKAYTVEYVNSLIAGTVAAIDKDRKTYSATKIDEMFQDIEDNLETLLNTWGKISDLIPATPSGD